MKHQLAALCVSLTLPAVSAMAATVTPEQVKALPLGTAFAGIPTGEFAAGAAIPSGKGSEVQLVRTADGYTYVHANGGRGAADAQKVICNDISKAGGKGNATINCALPGDKQLRFEWTDIDNVKYEYWFSMKHKAGQTQNRQSQASATLTKQTPERTGKVIPPGTYTVSFNNNWAPVTYVLEPTGKFTEQGSKPRVGSWQELDGDFCHIDAEVHCYKLLSKGADNTIQLQYKKADGTEGHRATWKPKG